MAKKEKQTKRASSSRPSTAGTKPTSAVAPPRSRSRGIQAPRKWTREELEADRQKSEKNYVLTRETEGSAAFYDAFTAAESAVNTAMTATQDLRAMTGDVLLEMPKLWQTLRYLCAPPVSEEDIWTLVGKKFGKSIRESMRSWICC